MLKIKSKVKEIAEKFDCPIEIARKIKDNYPRCWVLVQEFSIYDICNDKDPQVSALKDLISKNPDYRVDHWKDHDPCLNWGQTVRRLESEEERDHRIREEIKEIIRSYT